MVGAELDLVLGQDHPVRDFAADLAPLELEPARQNGPGQRHRDRRAWPEVPGAADDLPGLSFADVDAAELQPIGVRVLLGLEHAADPEPLQVAVRIRDADPFDSLDLGGRDGKLLG